MYRVLRVLMSRHLMAHLFIPLIVGLGFEMLIDYLIHGTFPEWRAFVKDKSTLIAGIVFTYVLVAAYFIHRETSNQKEKSQLADLMFALSSAKSFFATDTLSLKEWFEPSTQIYFAHVVRQKMIDNTFHQARVVLLFTSGDVKNCRTEYLDKPYANAFIEIHKSFGIDLAALDRTEINEILKELDFEEKNLLHLFPSWIKLFPSFIQNGYLKVRRKIPELDFAFITHADSTTTVFPFSKRGKSRRIYSQEYKNQQRIKAYEKVMSLIKDRIYLDKPGPPELDAKYTFANKIDVL